MEAARNLSCRHIALLDNDPITLYGLSSIIRQAGIGKIMWGLQSGHEAVVRCLGKDERPDLLMVDMSMEGVTGVDVCMQVRRKTASVPLLAMTSFSTAHYARRAAEAGAQGMVSKSDEHALIKAMRTVMGGGVWGEGFEPAATAHIRVKNHHDEPRFLLSDREIEAMNLLAKGCSTARTAELMQVSQSSVKSFVARAREKLNAKTMREAIALWTGEAKR
jgi:DNA-binding NarL/FixJ family response regulator